MLRRYTANADGSDQGAVYRREYGRITDTQSNNSQRRLRLTQLEALDNYWQQNCRFSSPYYWAPQRWGYNVIQLTPEDYAASVDVQFRGVIQNGGNAGWRWGLVGDTTTGVSSAIDVDSSAEACS